MLPFRHLGAALGILIGWQHGLMQGVAHQNYAWQGSIQPAGKPEGLFACLLILRTVLRSRTNSEAVSGIVEPPMAVAGSPISIGHIPVPALAAHSPSVHLLQGEVLPPVDFERAHVCRTIGYSDRLRQHPAGKPLCITHIAGRDPSLAHGGRRSGRRSARTRRRQYR
jgi:hypothetical protein